MQDKHGWRNSSPCTEGKHLVYTGSQQEGPVCQLTHFLIIMCGKMKPRHPVNNTSSWIFSAIRNLKRRVRDWKAKRLNYQIKIVTLKQVSGLLMEYINGSAGIVPVLYNTCSSATQSCSYVFGPSKQTHPRLARNCVHLSLISHQKRCGWHST